MARKRLNSVIGIDIGSQSIKVAEIRRSGNDNAVSALGITATPPGTVDHTGVYDTDLIGAAIKGLCAETGATSKDVVISVAGQASILVRTLEVPRMNPSELKAHMDWEISRNIPFAESTVMSDYRTVPGQDPGSANMDVVMAIAPQTAVDTLMGICKKAGKVAHALDVEPLAIARVLANGYAGDIAGQTVCVVEMGSKTTAINIYKDGQLLLPRQVPVGGDQFTSSLSSSLGMSNEDSEAVKRDKVVVPTNPAPPAVPGMFNATDTFQAYNPFAEDAPPAMDYSAPADEPQYAEPQYSEPQYTEPSYQASDSAGDFSPPDYSSDLPDADVPPAYSSPFDDTPAYAPEPSLVPAASSDDDRYFGAIAVDVDEFVAEVRRSIDYFRSKGGDVNRIYVCGGGIRLKGLGELIEQAIGLPTEVLDPFRNMSISARKLAPGVLEEHRSEFTIAVGNALHISFD